MNILTRGDWLLKTTVTHQIPHHLQSYLIPFFEPRLTLFPGGNFLSQRLKEEDFNISVHHFFITEPCCLYPFTKQIAVTLHHTIKGNIACELKSFGKVFLQEGTYHLFCVPPDVYHQAHFEPGHYLSFHMDIQRPLTPHIALNEAIEDALIQFFRNPRSVGLQLYEGKSKPAISRAIHAIVDCRVKEEGYFKLLVREKFYEILRGYAEDVLWKPNQELNEQYVFLKIVRFIEQHLEEVRLKEKIINRFYYTPTQLQRIFKRHYGDSLQHFIFNTRMQKAKKYLQETNNSIADISLQVGYQDSSAFSRAFRKCFGVSPVAFRNRHTGLI